METTYNEIEARRAALPYTPENAAEHDRLATESATAYAAMVWERMGF